MCTASWWHSADGGYELFFNRDEQKSRARAEAPGVERADGVGYLAPRDGQRGGTWIAVNEFGLTCCLINHHPDEMILPVAARSRGELVLRCVTAGDGDEVWSRMDAADLRAYAPFHLVALWTGGGVLRMTWDGRQLVRAAGGVCAPVTSSSFETQRVIVARHRAYAELATTVAGGGRPRLEVFQDAHDPGNGAYSVCMNRVDACTVSQTRVVVGGAEVAMDYRALDWTRVAAAGERQVWMEPVRRCVLPRRSAAGVV